MRGSWLTLLAVAVASPASADWLADVWSNDVSYNNGYPAITFNTTGVVTVALPEAVLAQARGAGLGVEAAVSAFLGRYAPRMCTTLIDMTVPHPNLKVDLLVEHSVQIDAADPAVQEQAATALNNALKSPGTKSVPRINRAFVVDQRPLSLSINYVPGDEVHCVEPAAAHS